MNFPYKKQVDMFINFVFMAVAIFFIVCFYFQANYDKYHQPKQESVLEVVEK